MKKAKYKPMPTRRIPPRPERAEVRRRMALYRQAQHAWRECASPLDKRPKPSSFGLGKWLKDT